MKAPPITWQVVVVLGLGVALLALCAALDHAVVSSIAGGVLTAGALLLRSPLKDGAS